MSGARMKKRDRERTMPQAIQILLDELCADLGFCLPPNEKTRLCSAERWDADEFASAVFQAEGMKIGEHLSLGRQVRRRFTDRFGASIDRTSFQMQ